MRKRHALLFVSCVLLGFGVSSIKEDKKVNDDFIMEDYVVTEGNMDIRIRGGKLKRVGDTTIIEASVNSDATIQSIEFTSSRTDVIQVLYRNEKSATLKKLKQFEGYVYITAKSRDPFVSVSAQCKFRCYNPIVSLGDAGAIAFQGDTRIGTLGSDIDEFILKRGLTYKGYIDITTYFGDFDEPNEGGTEVKIEPEAMQEFKNSIQTALGSNNPITSISQDEDYDGRGTTEFCFNFTCNEEFEGIRTVEVDGKTATWRFKKYVAVSSMQGINPDGVYVI